MLFFGKLFEFAYRLLSLFSLRTKVTLAANRRRVEKLNAFSMIILKIILDALLTLVRTTCQQGLECL